MTIRNICWVLPRPRQDHYIGSWPLHFGKKLKWELFGKQSNPLILNPFGGKSEVGLRCDMNKDVNPDFFADAHNLPFKDDIFDAVFLDPPYNNKLSKSLFGTGKLKFRVFINEAVRVCKPGGFVVSYHYVMTPRPQGTSYFLRIFVGTRVWHKLRVACIFKKEGYNRINTSLDEYNTPLARQSPDEVQGMG
jgi:SAM-dependent methyltransferase